MPISPGGNARIFLQKPSMICVRHFSGFLWRYIGWPWYSPQRSFCFEGLEPERLEGGLTIDQHANGWVLLVLLAVASGNKFLNTQESYH